MFVKVKPRQWRRALVRRARKTGSPVTLGRALIVAAAAGGMTPSVIAEAQNVSRTHVYRTLAAYDKEGWLALLDARKNNGPRKVDDNFRRVVRNLLQQSPQDYRYIRPTWTRELLIIVAEEQTSIRVSLSSMSRILKKVGARRGRPKPVVSSTLSERQKRRRIAEIRVTVKSLPADEVAVYEDEVDIHLNPKIGLDWMNKGEQKQVMTPGKNEKGYLAGTLDARDGTVLWVGSDRKNSDLFIAMLRKLEEHYTSASRIHVILDNYGIHKSADVQDVLMSMPRIRLLFLPPYCPDENRIERLWQDLHANVTRNHRQTTLRGLCGAVADYLDRVTPWARRDNAVRPPMKMAA